MGQQNSQMGPAYQMASHPSHLPSNLCEGMGHPVLIGQTWHCVGWKPTGTCENGYTSVDKKFGNSHMIVCMPDHLKR